MNNENLQVYLEPDIRYTITLTSGEKLTNLRTNGSYYISNKVVTEDTFLNNLYNVKISDGENETIYEVMKLIIVEQRESEYWFALRDLTPEELERDRQWAAIEYMAMMSGIEL